MTNRYELLLGAIADTDRFLVQMFLFALVAIIAYRTLEWTPLFIRRPVKYLYLLMGLACFIFATVYSWLLQ